MTSNIGLTASYDSSFFSIELLAPAFPKELREELYPVIEQLQRQLGDLHDHVVASDRLSKWAAETTSQAEAILIKRFRKHQLKKLKSELRDFASWWTLEFEAQLRAAFEKLLDE